jgi:hypothetical protein
MLLSIVSSMLVTGAAVNINYGFKTQRVPSSPGVGPSFNNHRVFHPAFPAAIRTPISYDEINKLLTIKDALSSPQEAAFATTSIAPKLPWKVLPQIGVIDAQNPLSKNQLEDAYDSNRHHGLVMYGFKIKAIETGTVLLNNWAQQAVLITSYSVERGAEGVELLTAKGVEANIFKWPPLALEFEVADAKWQPVYLSDKYFEALEFMHAFPKGAWELAFLLLLTPEDSQATEALFDTGICPQQGLVAYLRIIHQLQQRTGQWDDVPPHRKITEKSILKQ